MNRRLTLRCVKECHAVLECAKTHQVDIQDAFIKRQQEQHLFLHGVRLTLRLSWLASLLLAVLVCLASAACYVFEL